MWREKGRDSESGEKNLSVGSIVNCVLCISFFSAFSFTYLSSTIPSIWTLSLLTLDFFLTCIHTRYSHTCVSFFKKNSWRLSFISLGCVRTRTYFARSQVPLMKNPKTQQFWNSTNVPQSSPSIHLREIRLNLNKNVSQVCLVAFRRFVLCMSSL